MQWKEGRKGFVEGHTETLGRMKLDMTLYDKMKPNWLSHLRCIDRCRRKVLWLYVTRSTNWPHNIAAYYLDAVEKQGGSVLRN